MQWVFSLSSRLNGTFTLSNNGSNSLITGFLNRGARISLALAFARIFPVGEPTRRYAIGLAIVFFFLFTAAIIQGIFFCTKLSAWLYIDNLIQCDFSKTLVIYLVIGESSGYLAT